MKLTPQILCHNNTHSPVSCHRIRLAARQYLNRYGDFRPQLVDITLVGQETMRALNNKYRKIDAPTDILTFTHRHDQAVIGELYINPTLAFRKHFTLEELVAHGIDHCRGSHH